MKEASTFGTVPLGKLLRQQAIPASVGILVMAIYGIVDTIYVGRYIGPLGISAITVVMPITFLISSIGMAIGGGGSSIISRALGRKDYGHAHRTFGNQVMLTLTLALIFVGLGFVFMEDILRLFGGKGDVLEPARAYFQILLISVPFLAWAMMSNNIIRAEGFPKIAMWILLIPALTNFVLDPIFIIGLGWGMEGAAWATALAYMASGLFGLYFFAFGRSEMDLSWRSLRPSWPIIQEISSLGSVTLARQGTISVLAIVLNNSLFAYGGELGLAMYGIISRALMFTNFPVLGITQGFVPIVGYNYGANHEARVSGITRLAITSATLISLGLFTGIMLLAEPIVRIFTTDAAVIERTVPALRTVFLATPLLATSLMGSAFFQAIGKGRKALVLALSKQGFFLIPLIYFLPMWLGVDGIWMSFPIADTGAALISLIYLKKAGVRMPWETSKLAMQPAEASGPAGKG